MIAMVPYLYVSAKYSVFSLSITTPEIFVVVFLVLGVTVLYIAYNKNNSDE